MATKIKPKRGSGAPTTSDLDTNEIAMDMANGNLYVNNSGSIAILAQKNPANTDAISEGSSNLYYTDARADARAQLKIDALIDSAPGTLDTLNELAAALGDDASFSTTVTNSIATKLPLAGGTMTGALTLSGAPTSTLHAATKSYVDSAVTTGTGSITTSDVAEGTNLYYTNARAQAVSINNVVEDTTPQLGGDLDLNGARQIKDGSDKLITYHESGSDNELRFYAQNGQEQFRIVGESFGSDNYSKFLMNNSNAYVHLDGSDAIYTSTSGSSTFVRRSTDFNDPCLIVGRADADDADVTLDFMQFDDDSDGFPSSKTATTARLDAYRGASDNNTLLIYVDDDDSLMECFRFTVDGGNVVNRAKSKFVVVNANNDDLFVVEEDEATKFISGSSANSTLDIQHELATNDTNHTMVRFQTDMTSQANYDHTLGFFAETTGDNVSGDEGIVGDFRFHYKAAGDHTMRIALDRRLNGQQFSKATFETSFDVTSINNMMKLAPIAKGSTRPSSPSNGDIFFDTDDKQLFIYANGWQAVTNQRGMMFCGNDGVFHGYDGSAWKSFDMTAI